MSPSREKFTKSLTKVLSDVPILLSEHMAQSEEFVDVSSMYDRETESHQTLPSNLTTSNGYVLRNEYNQHNLCCWVLVGSPVKSVIYCNNFDNHFNWKIMFFASTVIS